MVGTAYPSIYIHCLFSNPLNSTTEVTVTEITNVDASRSKIVFRKFGKVVFVNVQINVGSQPTAQTDCAFDIPEGFFPTGTNVCKYAFQHTSAVIFTGLNTNGTGYVRYMTGSMSSTWIYDAIAYIQ